MKGNDGVDMDIWTVDLDYIFGALFLFDFVFRILLDSLLVSFRFDF